MGIFKEDFNSIKIIEWPELVEIDLKNKLELHFKYSGKENLNVVITPGLIPFLYYTGSVTFVFISMIIIILFCSLIEKLFFLYSAKNQLLINIIGYAMAVRAAHFGYLPYNTINYLLSIFLTLLFVYILSIFIWKKS